METTFTDHETRFVLGEMIKASSIDVSFLVDFIKSHNVEQNWLLMQLPIGRNMSQCMGVVEKMLPVYPPTFPSLKRKSFSDVNDQPMKRQAIHVMTPIEPAVPPRIIQPRPPPNGYPSTAPASSSPSTMTTGKKRGRPSKADKEAQARANFSRSMEYAPITPAPLAPMAVLPQREYASSPAYEFASSSVDQKPKKRSRPDASDASPAGGAYPLASPASAADTPRALPDPLEHVEQSNMSPRDRGRPAPDSRSPPLLPQMQTQPPQGRQHSLQAQTQPPLPPSQTPRPPPVYEPYRGRDPIFPDRDRSRAVSDHVPRDTPPAPPLANRT